MRTFAPRKRMKKALLYLLLALGISIAVLLVGGAFVGFITGFIDGYNDNPTGTTDSEVVMYIMIGICFLLICGLLHLVFIRRGFSSYSWGRIPEGERQKVIIPMIIVMCGMAFVYQYVGNLQPDNEDKEMFLWLHKHPWFSVPLTFLMEATGYLVFFGGILRELLEWKHRPVLIIGSLALLSGVIFWLAEDNPWVVGLTVVIYIIDAWVYECTRSIVPSVCGSLCFESINFLTSSYTPTSWYLLVALVLILPWLFSLHKAMDPYKPID